MPRANNEFSFLDNHAKTKIYRGKQKKFNICLIPFLWRDLYVFALFFNVGFLLKCCFLPHIYFHSFVGGQKIASSHSFKLCFRIGIF